VRTRADGSERRARDDELPRRPSPPAASDRVLALQRTLGNASLSRVLGRARLQRLRKEDEENHITLGYMIEGLEHYKSLLLPTQTRWNEYHYQEYLTLRLQRDVDPHIDRLKQLRLDIDAEVDPVAKFNEARAVAKKALAALHKINKEGQADDEAAVTEAFKKAAVDRKARLEKELGARKATLAAEALQQQLQAEEQARQQSITNTGVTPNAAGPAFVRPYNAVGRQNLHTWITLSWKPFRNLPLDDLRNVNCFVYHLTLDQLNDLLGRLGDVVVTEFGYQGWPATRAPLVNTAQGLVMPVKVSGVSARIGAEVVIDWVRHNPGHTAPAGNLVQSFNFTADEQNFQRFGGSIQTSQGRKTYTYNAGRRLVVTDSRDAVITYYNGN